MFTGFVLMTLANLTSEGNGTGMAIIYFTLAIFCSVVNSIYLQPLILYFILFKNYYKRGKSPWISLIHFVGVMAFTIGVILFMTPLKVDQILIQLSWSYKKIKIDETNVNPYNFMTNLMEWYYN